MLTRLRVKGFKNLRDVDLHFGPFTCIAGPNGVGKSNLFDAITLLSALARKPLIEAMLSVRGANGRINDVASLFGPVAPGVVPSIEWIADIVVPRSTVDDFDRATRPTATFLEYSLKVCLDQGRGSVDRDPVFIEHEELRAKSSSEASKWLPFHPGKPWISRHIAGPGQRTAPFIRTDLATEAGEEPSIKLLGDKSRGRPFGVPARKAPQTVLSTVNSSSHPTALAARNELRSWRLLQLEPSALRRPDELRGSPAISATGEHLPAALTRIGSQGEVATRLSELVPGVVSVDVDVDKVRETRTLKVVMRDQRAYSASSLSDGTLRFLALAIMASDPETSGLMCMEEPENGIHPSRVLDMIRLIRSLADDEDADVEYREREAVRQVLINTHSPLVVGHLPDDALLIAETLRQKGVEFVSFKPMPDTWRADYGDLKGSSTVTRGELEKYLGVLQSKSDSAAPKHRTVKDHLTADLFATS